jgi:hypothetical protein
MSINIKIIKKGDFVMYNVMVRSCFWNGFISGYGMGVKDRRRRDVTLENLDTRQEQKVYYCITAFLVIASSLFSNQQNRGPRKIAECAVSTFFGIQMGKRVAEVVCSQLIFLKQINLPRNGNKPGDGLPKAKSEATDL